MQAAAGAAGWWWHLPHFSIAAAALVLHFPQELPAGKGHLCFILLDITIYYLEPAVFLPKDAAWQQKRPQICPGLAGKDRRPMMEQEAESFPGRNPPESG